MSRSRFCGEANAYDITNGKVYLGDLCYSWGLGDSLAGFTLGGTTNPTISMDGQIDIYDATAGGGSSFLTIPIPNTLGELFCIIHCKVTVMVDDTSLGDYGIFTGLTDVGMNSGAVLWFKPSTSLWSINWRNTGALGVTTVLTEPSVIKGNEYDLDIVVSTPYNIYFINNKWVGTILHGIKGTAPLSLTPVQDWRNRVKNWSFYTAHNAGQITHIRVRQIRVSKLVGVSSM